MEILESILESIGEDAPVEEVRRGIHWTAVVSRRCGLASTMAHGGCNHEEGGGMEGSLTEMTALGLARYCLRGDTAKASLGLAAINSLLDVDPDRYADIDGLQIVKEMGKGKNVSVIGHFPFLDTIAREANNLWIIEKQPRPGDYPEEKGRDFLPQSDIVVISSTTLLNNTLSGILGLCREGSVKMLLGPTTPLSGVLFDYGIDMLAGSVVTEKDRVLRSVSEGATFMQLKMRGGIRFVSMIKDYDDIVRRLAG
ncbi:MAG: hypothetical protein A4E64_02206 [Syntrophorhabdus sp. PtaU1.Bin058]|nr:MAG: hypothetical protein A4E64_02206 [Syntrophorhabdus sp. PtaU1.Bin058]